MPFIIGNVLLAAVPVVILLFLFLRRDTRKKESAFYVWRAFVLGFIALFPAALIELGISALPVALTEMGTDLFRAYLVSGLVEEATKLAVVMIFIYSKPYFDEASDGIIYTVTTSLGLAFFENILYSFGSLATLIIRAFTAVPLHASASGIMGYFVGQSKFSERPQIFPGLLAAVAVHGTYNFLLFLGGWKSFLTIPLLVAAFWIVFRLFRKAVNDDVEAERA